MCSLGLRGDTQPLSHVGWATIFLTIPVAFMDGSFLAMYPVSEVLADSCCWSHLSNKASSSTGTLIVSQVFRDTCSYKYVEPWNRSVLKSSFQVSPLHIHLTETHLSVRKLKNEVMASMRPPFCLYILFQYILFSFYSTCPQRPPLCSLCSAEMEEEADNLGETNRCFGKWIWKPWGVAKWKRWGYLQKPPESAGQPSYLRRQQPLLSESDRLPPPSPSKTF